MEEEIWLPIFSIPSSFPPSPCAARRCVLLSRTRVARLCTYCSISRRILVEWTGVICVEIDIKAELVRLAEPEYAVFSRRLLPGTENVLGVRLPLLRRLARRIAKGDWAAYLDTAGDGSFEEVMLQGMVIGAICAPPQEVLARTAAFVPKIDNWSVCDSFCSGLKLARTHPEPVWEFLQPYFEDPRPFAVRFAVVMLLFYYIDAQHLPRVLALLEEVHSDEYYVKMAVAWAASMCYAAFPDETLPWLQAARLDEFTYRRTIRKICESHQVNAEQKSHLGALERRRQG